MATLKEIEWRIKEHKKRLVDLDGEPKSNEKIRVTKNLIGFWTNQKLKALRIENRLKSK